MKRQGHHQHLLGAGIAVCLFAAAGHALAAPNAKALGDATVIVGERIGERGRTVVVPVSVFGDGATVRFAAEVRFDASRLTLVTSQIRTAPDTTCAPRPAPNDDRIEINNAAQTSQTPIPSDPLNPSGRTFCDLTFRVKADAPGGDALLEVLAPVCSDEFGATAACRTDNGKIAISAVASSPANGGTLTIAGRAADLVESRLLLITNLEPPTGATLVVSNCLVSGQGFRLASSPGVSIPPSSLAGAARGTIGVECDLPANGTSYGGGQLQCDTSDAAVPRLTYGLECVSVPPEQPLPADQLQSAELESGDQFGTSTAAATDAGTEPVVAVGAPFGGPDGTGEVYVLEQQPVAKRMAPGESVEEIDGVGVRADVTYRVLGVLRLPPSSKPRSKNLTNLARFGAQVGFSPDRSRVAVGAPGAGTAGRGQVLIYERPPEGWGQGSVGGTPSTVVEGPIENNATPGEFGSQISFNNSGELVIGAPGTSVGGMAAAGAVYVFSPLAGGGYDFGQRVDSPAAIPAGRFGESIGVSEGTLVVGAPNESPNGAQSGSAYMARLFGAQVGQVMPLVPQTRTPGDSFGSSVAVRGNTILIGSSGADTPAGSNSGRAVVFDLDPATDDVDEVAELQPNAGTEQGAGGRVALNGDLIIVGAPFAMNSEGVRAGRALVYDGGEKVGRSAANASPRTRRPKSVIENRGGGEGDRFANAIAVDGKTLLVGVPLFDREAQAGGQPVADVGRADPFELSGVFRSSFE